MSIGLGRDAATGDPFGKINFYTEWGGTDGSGATLSMNNFSLETIVSEGVSGDLDGSSIGTAEVSVEITKVTDMNTGKLTSITFAATPSEGTSLPDVIHTFEVVDAPEDAPAYGDGIQYSRTTNGVTETWVYHGTRTESVGGFPAYQYREQRPDGTIYEMGSAPNYELDEFGYPTGNGERIELQVTTPPGTSKEFRQETQREYRLYVGWSALEYLVSEVRTVGASPGISQTTYFGWEPDDPELAGSMKKRWQLDPDGKWVVYFYDAWWTLEYELRPWLDGPPGVDADPAAFFDDLIDTIEDGGAAATALLTKCIKTTSPPENSPGVGSHTYTAGSLTGSIYRARRTSGGLPASFYSRPLDALLGGVSLESMREDVLERWDGAGNHDIEITLADSSTLGGASRVYLRYKPAAGVATTYFYGVDEATGNATKTESTLAFYPYPENKSTRAWHQLDHVTVSDNRGRTLSRSKVVHYGQTTTTATTTTYDYDEHGLLSQTDDGRITYSRGAVTVDGGHKSYTETDAYGVEHTRTFDEYGELVEEIKSAIVAGADHAAQAAIKTSYGWSKTGSALTRTIVESVVGGSASRTSSTMISDAIGRQLSSVDEQGRVTQTSYSPDGRTITTTLPGNLTRIETFYRDGQLKSVSGTGALAEYHIYTVNDGTDSAYPAGSITEQVFYNDDGSGAVRSKRWRKTTTNSLGWVLSEESPGPGKDENGANVVIEKKHHYDLAGRRVRTETTGLGDTLYAYDEFGNLMVQWVDADGDESLDNDGDRVIQSDYTSYGPWAGGWAEFRSSYAPPPPRVGGSATSAQPVQVVQVLAGGPEAPVIAYYSDGSQVTMETAIDRDTGRTTRTSTRRWSGSSGDSLDVTVQTWVNGLLVKQTVPGATEAITYGHDDYGRQNGIDDPRSGETSWQLSDGGDVLSRTDAVGVVTTYTYHPAAGAQAGALKSVTTAAGDATPATYYDQDPAQRIYYQWGTATTPLKYILNAYGQMIELHTYPNKADFASGPARPAGFAQEGRKTVWTYDEASGALTGKIMGGDSLGVEYAYNNAGLIDSRTWARENGSGERVKTTYQYETAGTGRLARISYNDGTPQVDYTAYDSFNAIKGMTDAAGEHLLGTSANSASVKDFVTGGLLGGVKVDTWRQSALVLDVKMNNTALMAAEYRATMWPRVDNIRVGTLNGTVMDEKHRFSFSYRSNDGKLGGVKAEDLANQYVFANGGGRPTGYRSLRSTRQYDPVTGRPSDLRWFMDVTGTNAAQTTLVGWEFAEYDYAGRRKQVDAHSTLSGRPGWSYAYDDAGQVTGAGRFNAGGVIDSQARGYDYDGVGNRQNATRGPAAQTRTTTYRSNDLNQYETGDGAPAIAHHRFFEITGQTATGATVNVEVNGTPLAHDGIGTGEPGSYRAETQVAGNGAQWVDVKVTAQLGNLSPVVRRGWTYVPPAEEDLVYDLDGNLIEDGRWKYGWDAENRLIWQEEKAVPVSAGADPALAPPVRRRLEFAYDGRHRRVRKVVKNWDAAAGTFGAPVKDIRFVYDGWNLVAELDALQSMQAIRTYVWGPDLSGTLEGAGGVGGLLAMFHKGVSYQVCTDANGNVSALYASRGPQKGTMVARFDYDPFGNRITNTGVDAEICPFGFSTKYRDEETGLYYYGYRYYSPELGRWPSRDPIGERGGLNLYGMVGNDPVNQIDVLGLSTSKAQGETTLKALAGKMKALCPKCCPSNTAKCESDAQRITDALVSTWNANYGHGDNTHRHAVGGYLCWDWSRVFNQAANLVGSKTWHSEEKMWHDTSSKEGIVHFAIRLWACCDKEECSIYVDDGWGPPADETVHPPPWPGPPYEPGTWKPGTGTGPGNYGTPTPTPALPATPVP